jgi:hypothetical protein
VRVEKISMAVQLDFEMPKEVVEFAVFKKLVHHDPHYLVEGD